MRLDSDGRDVADLPGLWDEGDTMTELAAERPCVIYGTDIGKQPDELIEEVRNGLSHLRGQLADIRRAYGWDDRIEQSEGALTVLICALAYASEELREFRLKNGELKWRRRDEIHRVP